MKIYIVLICTAFLWLSIAATQIAVTKNEDNNQVYGFSKIFNNCTDPDTPCMNGGHCSMDNIYQCECSSDFTGADCRQKVCQGGTVDPLNVCSCPKGWGGESCVACTSDFGCQMRFNSTNTTAFCDKTYITQKKKYFECVITDELTIQQIGNITTIQCTDVGFDHDRGTCEFQAWAMDSGNLPLGYKAEVFYCTFFNCKANLYADDPDKVSYDCKTSKCKCTELSDRCNEWVRFIVDGMVGKASVACNNKTKECSVTHENYPGVISMNCFGSECITEFLPPPPRPADDSWIYLMVASISGGVLGGIVFLTITISLIISCCHTRSASIEYHKIKHIAHGASLEFKNLTYKLKVKEKGKTVNKVLLNNVSHIIKPGSVVAIMGPSGAGKTTLLDIIANRTKRGKIAGQILVNGRPIDKSYKRTAGYVFQEDNLMSTLTVKECLMFSANLRLPDCVSRAEKEQKVEEVMRELGISHIADRKIGDTMSRGISGGEKRRVSIGMELVISPYILFLDEPTSGLDSNSAYSVVTSLVNLAKKGRTIVFSIHQPRSNIFNQFDEILLLSGGRIAYAGPANHSVEYFAKLGYECPVNFNPADFIIDVLAQAQSEGKVLNYETQSVQVYGSLPRPAAVIQNAQSAQNPTVYGSVEKYSPAPVQKRVSFQEENPEYMDETQLLINAGEVDMTQVKLLPHATSLFSQIQTLSRRAFVNFYRNFYLMPAHYLSALAVGALLGAAYYHLGLNLQAVQNRIGAMFFMMSLLSFGAMSSLELFITERSIYVREKANGYYYSLAYFISKVLFDIIPLRIVPPIITGSIAYYLIGLRAGPTYFAWFILIMILFNLVSGALCIMIGAIAPSVASGNVMAVLAILMNSLFAGFLLNKESTPPYLTWVKYLSFWNYSFEALLINELRGVEVLIDPKGSPPFHADGMFWLNELGMDPGRFYMDVIILAAFAILFLSISGILMKLFVKEKR